MLNFKVDGADSSPRPPCITVGTLLGLEGGAQSTIFSHLAHPSSDQVRIPPGQFLDPHTFIDSFPLGTVSRANVHILDSTPDIIRL